jgi:quercetin dioxygenase-like cupin family protein
VPSETSSDKTLNSTVDGAWTAADPLSIAFRLVRATGEWQRLAGPLAALEVRDLGLAAASNGQLGAWQVRVAAPATVELDWHMHDLDFSFLYVLEGSIEIEHEAADRVTLARTDVGMIPALLRHRVVMSRDFEALVVIAPGDFQRLAISEGSDPLARSLGWWPGPPRYLRGGEEAFERRGLRSFFSYRDLGTVEPTAGRLGVNILRAVEASASAEGTGWHYHSMGQLVVVLSGTAEVSIGGHGTVVTGAYDSMCVGAGVVHNVYSFSEDYELIEFCVPATYDTVAVQPL